MTPLHIFVDSDVIISSFLSIDGASFYLLNEKSFKNSKFFISDFSVLELELVTKKRSIPPLELSKLIAKRLTIQKLNQPKEFFDKYKKYVHDPEDAHIVAGADQTKSKFLLTYNIKDYKIDVIKNNLGIIITKPGNFLQFLRSS